MALRLPKATANGHRQVAQALWRNAPNLPTQAERVRALKQAAAQPLPEYPTEPAEQTEDIAAEQLNGRVRIQLRPCSEAEPEGAILEADYTYDPQTNAVYVFEGGTMLGKQRLRMTDDAADVARRILWNSTSP
jgi:hypothetical protein